jgi:hypothetical protein
MVSDEYRAESSLAKSAKFAVFEAAVNFHERARFVPSRPNFSISPVKRSWNRSNATDGSGIPPDGPGPSLFH